MLKYRLLVALVAATLAGGVWAQGTGQSEAVYGSQMMTEQERFEYQERMRKAETAEERDRLRAEHHQRMETRARERGVELPAEPPARGPDTMRGGGRGAGMEPTPGQGLGPTPGQGTGQGAYGDRGPGTAPRGGGGGR